MYRRHISRLFPVCSLFESTSPRRSQATQHPQSEQEESYWTEGADMMFFFLTGRMAYSQVG